MTARRLSMATNCAMFMLMSMRGATIARDSTLTAGKRAITFGVMQGIIVAPNGDVWALDFKKKPSAVPP
jgi:hypothetical protein